VIGLPSLRVLDGAPGPRIWLASEATDMRCGFDRLVQAVIGGDPLSGHLPIAWRRSLEDPDLGPRWLCAVVQAAGGGRVQASACRAWCGFG
jgi:hypothetical protein